MKTLVIAEPGGTHEGSFDKLMELLETAHACGAGCYKPQWVSDPVQMCERRHIGPDHPKRDYYLRAYSWLAFPVEWHAQLRARCTQLGMRYFCTVFLPGDVPIVGRFAERLKISSFENEDHDLIQAAFNWNHDEVIMSLGMWDLDNFIWVNGEFYLLHCVSAYPAPLEAMNLSVLSQDWCDGLSDHSRDVRTGMVAVARGARIIETHFRLDDCDPENPDHAVAFTPSEFAQYIRNIRDAELMLGTGEKAVQPCEEWALPYRVTS